MKRFLAYGCSITSIVIGYPSLLWLTGHQLLSVFSVALLAIFAFATCRAIQHRGRVTLAVTVFVIPFLIAGICTVYLQLSPFLSRQRSTVSLRDAGVTVNARLPDQAGEFMMNRSGSMLPTWIAKTIGKDCLAEVRSIRSELSKMNVSDLENLDTSRLFIVELSQGTSDVHLDTKLIRWLNSCSDLEQVRLDFCNFTEMDEESLSELSDSIECYVTIRNCESVLLKSLRNADWLHLIGKSLSEVNIRHLARNAGSPFLTIEVKDFPTQWMPILSEYESHIRWIAGVRAEELSEISKMGLKSLSLEDLSSEELINIRALVAGSTATDFLSISQSSLTLEDYKQLARLFRCETLQLSIVPKINAHTDEVEVWNSERFTPFWELPDLKEVRYFDGNWNLLNRPATQLPIRE